MIQWYFVAVHNDSLCIEGRDLSWLSYNMFYSTARDLNTTNYPQYQKYSIFDLITLYGIAQRGRIIQFCIQLSHFNRHIMSFHFTFKGNSISIRDSYASSSHLQHIPQQYYAHSDFIIQHQEKQLVVYPYRSFHHFIKELQYLQQLWKLDKHHLVWYRIMFWLFYTQDKQICLVSDRYSQANDHGEYLFSYIIIYYR